MECQDNILSQISSEKSQVHIVEKENCNQSQSNEEQAIEFETENVLTSDDDCAIEDGAEEPKTLVESEIMDSVQCDIIKTSSESYQRIENKKKDMEWNPIIEVHPTPTKEENGLSTCLPPSPIDDDDASPVHFFFTEEVDDKKDENDKISYSDSNTHDVHDDNNGALTLSDVHLVKGSKEIVDSDAGRDVIHKQSYTGYSIKGNLDAYRNKPSLVNYSDSEETDSDSTSSYDDLDDDDDKKKKIDVSDSGHDTDSDKDGKKKHRKKGKDFSTKELARTDGEVFPEELPPINYLTISEAGKDIELVSVGTVSGIVDVLVVIQAIDTSPALYDDTVLFMENRQPLGLIFETLGTVERPYYSVRFNSNQDILNRNINIGDRVMFAPKADSLTKYVFIAELKKMRGNDASWENDNEPPPEEKDYSDDEEEKMAKEALHLAILRGEYNPRRRHRRKRRSANAQQKAVSAAGSAPSRSGLLPGHLNRNPFERQHQPSSVHKNKNKAGHNQNRPAFLPPDKPGVSQWRASSSTVKFGGKPTWQEQPGLIGPRPGVSFNLNPPTFQPFTNPTPTGPPVGGPLGVVRPPPSGPFSQLTPFMPTFNPSVPPPQIPNPFSVQPPCNRPLPPPIPTPPATPILFSPFIPPPS